MNETEVKKNLWQKKWFPWVVVVVLVLVISILGWRLSLAHEQQNSMEAELQVQKASIDELRKKLGEKKDDEGLIHEATPTITNSVISERLSSLQELVTVEYIYTNAGQYVNNNQATVLLWELNVPFTEKSFLVAYDGQIKAGVDLSKAKVNVNESSHIITIILPESQIISHETFEKSLVVLDEKNNIFNPISISDYNEFVGTQKEAMEQKATERGVLTNANTEAKTIVKSFLEALPGINQYKLIFK